MRSRISTRSDVSRRVETMRPVGATNRLPNDRSFITGLARGLAVLLAFSEKRRHLSSAEISHRTGIPRAAVSRSLHTLKQLGYVSEDERRHFYLRPRVLLFGHAYLSGAPIVVVAQSVLDRLSDRMGEASSIGVLEGEEVVYVARAASAKILSPSLNVGSRLPAYCTSIGLVLLAEMSPRERGSYLSHVKLLQYTERTVRTSTKLKQVLESVANAGYAIADQQLSPGITSIAVPVRTIHGEVVAGINILFRSGSVPLREATSRFLRPLQEAAIELGLLLRG